jgi:hypothetical protein
VETLSGSMIGLWLFVLSVAASLMTGATVVVDGGLTIA